MADARKIPILPMICGGLLFGPLLIACDLQGPAERAGEKIDNAVEKAGDRIEDATDK